MDEQYAVQELTDIREERIRLRSTQEYNKLIREKLDLTIFKNTYKNRLKLLARKSQFSGIII